MSESFLTAIAAAVAAAILAALASFAIFFTVAPPRANEQDIAKAMLSILITSAISLIVGALAFYLVSKVAPLSYLRPIQIVSALTFISLGAWYLIAKGPTFTRSPYPLELELRASPDYFDNKEIVIRCGTQIEQVVPDPLRKDSGLSIMPFTTLEATTPVTPVIVIQDQRNGYSYHSHFEFKNAGVSKEWSPWLSPNGQSDDKANKDVRLRWRTKPTS